MRWRADTGGATPSQATVGRGKRFLWLGLVGLLVVVSAVGPARIARAVTAASSTPGFVPAARPVRVQAPSLRLTDLSGVTPNQPITLAGGDTSPADTVLLTFSTIELDNLVITGGDAGRYGLSIVNPGSGADAAQIGGPGQKVQLWGEVSSLSICLSADTLSSLASSYSAQLGGLLGTVLSLLGPLANSGPCLPLTSLLPVIGALLSAGVPLPATIPANDLDIQVYALQVTADGSQRSLHLPTGQLTVTGP